MIGTEYQPLPNVRLICGDVRHYTGHLTKARAGIMDPPYPMQSGGNSGTHFKGGKLAGYANDGKVVDCDITWQEIMHAVDLWTEDQSDIFIMTSDCLENPQKAHAAAKAVGMRYHKTWFWDKGAPTPSRWGMTHLEHILYLYKGAARAINNPSQKQVLRVGRCKESSHPTPKPVPLMRRLVQAVTQPGDVVADLFMGSGATPVACVLEGRGFVGFEKDPRFFIEACDRVDRAIQTRAIHEQIGAVE